MQLLKRLYRVLNGKEFMINGIGGGALVFSLTSLIIQPFIVMVSIIFSDIDSKLLASMYLNISIVIIIENILSILLMVLGIYTALFLLRKKNKAISLTKVFLSAIVIHKIISIMIVYSTGMLKNSFIVKALIEIILAIIYSSAWYIYFSKSKGVKAIYDAER